MVLLGVVFGSYFALHRNFLGERYVPIWAYRQGAILGV
jgi:hypothetical protein